MGERGERAGIFDSLMLLQVATYRDDGAIPCGSRVDCLAEHGFDLSCSLSPFVMCRGFSELTTLS